MSSPKDSRSRTLPSISEVADHYLHCDNLVADECLPKEIFVGVKRPVQKELFEPEHLSQCVRCASLRTLIRSHSVLKRLPDRLSVSIPAVPEATSASVEHEALQILGFISLEPVRFEFVSDDSTWVSHPLFMRVNLVVDPLIDLFALSILDVPEEIETIVITTPHGQLSLAAGSPQGTFELFDTVSFCGASHRPIPPADSLLQFLCEGRMEIVLTPSTDRCKSDIEHERDFGALLADIGAIEMEYAYVLPTGLFCDTHINVAKLCESEDTIDRTAKEFDRLFPEDFDVIVTNGWPLATVARRIASLRNRRSGANRVCEIMYAGHIDPMPVEEMPSTPRVLVLIDVTVTGQLMKHLKQAVKRFGGKVVGAGAVVAAVAKLAGHSDGIRSLCKLPMVLSKTDDIKDLRWREKRHFNPLSSCMTEKKHAARSPTEFYNGDPEVRAFWNLLEGAIDSGIDIGSFYRHHKVVGNTHYCEFIDTLELLRYASLGKQLVEQVRDKLAERHIVPELLLCTDRLRGKTFASMLQESYQLTTEVPVQIVYATKRREGWVIANEQFATSLHDRRVLICDTAVGHGKTIDQLAMIANRYGARSVGAAVILSRLSESCEIAFQRRLSDGFYRLFNLPIRPVVVRSSSSDICPICQRQAAIEGAATETRSEAIQQLASRQSRIAFTRTTDKKSDEGSLPKETQLTLFESAQPSFLSTCHASVARGLTLHSLYAAQNNGMAPLRLPELTDREIPSKNRRAMVKDLPFGTLEWSGESLEETLKQCLASESTTGSIWAATAFVMAIEKRVQWFDELADVIERSVDVRTKPQPTFWNTIECGCYLIVRENHVEKERVTESLRSLVNRFSGTHAANGLNRVLGTITELAHISDV